MKRARRNEVPVEYRKTRKDILKEICFGFNRFAGVAIWAGFWALLTLIIMTAA